MDGPAAAEPSINVFIFFGLKKKIVFCPMVGVGTGRMSGTASAARTCSSCPGLLICPPHLGLRTQMPALSFHLQQITGRQRLSRDWQRAHPLGLARVKKLGRGHSF